MNGNSSAVHFLIVSPPSNGYAHYLSISKQFNRFGDAPTSYNSRIQFIPPNPSPASLDYVPSSNRLACPTTPLRCDYFQTVNRFLPRQPHGIGLRPAFGYCTLPRPSPANPPWIS